MGRKRKISNNKQQRHGKHHGKRRRRQADFWIESANSTLPMQNHEFHVIITRASLTDDHHRRRDGSAYDDIVASGGKGNSENCRHHAETSNGNMGNNANDDTTETAAVGQKTAEDDAKGDNISVPATSRGGKTERDRTKKPSIAVVKDASARCPYERQVNNGHVDLPHGDCGDGVINPYPTQVVPNKYWAQRYRLFSKFDQGCQLDSEGWFSVTPECIANHIAKEIVAKSASSSSSSKDSSSPSPGGAGIVVLDAFGGVGGNTIALALQEGVRMVICVDTSRERLEMAATNCSVYDVPKDAVLFVQGDAMEIMAHYKAGLLKVSVSPQSQGEPDECCDDVKGYRMITNNWNTLPESVDVIFLSPPWNGPTYINLGKQAYSLEHISLNEGKHDGIAILEVATEALQPEAGVVAYFLPRNTNGFRIGSCFFKLGYDSCVMEQNVLNGKLKTITVYATRPAS